MSLRPEDVQHKNVFSDFSCFYLSPSLQTIQIEFTLKENFPKSSSRDIERIPQRGQNSFNFLPFSI